MAKYLLIFGAGASYGSDTPDKTPPLGDGDLYNKLATFNPPGWGSLRPEEAALFKNDFEQGMENVFNNRQFDMLPLQRAMAAYFFKFIPNPTNLYYKLAQKITSFKNANNGTWSGAVMTLNYERLLQLSFLSTGNNIFMGKNNGTLTNPIELCVPHGSCNIFCSTVKARPSTKFTNCNVDGTPKMIFDPKEFKKEIENNAIPPVMSYFIPSKETMSGTTFIKHQRKRAGELIKQASTIIIVGLRARLHDKHIWGPLFKTESKIIYCSGQTAGEEFKTWCDKHRKDKLNIILPLFFQDAFEKICSEVGLTS